MRGLVLAGLLLSTTLGFAQDRDDRTERILKRVDDLLREEMGKVRRDVVQIVVEGLERRPQREPAKSGSSEGLDLITVDVLKKHAMTLASDEYGGRNAGYAGNDKAAAYCAEQFKLAGLKPAGDRNEKNEPTYFQKFEFQSFYTGSKKLRTQNVVGLLEGTDEKLKKEIVVVGAHFDHVGKEGEGRHLGRLGRATDEDGIWNGADDNGSGTTCVLGLAKAFGEGAIKSKRSILFILFSAEEAGLYGSQWYCEHPTVAPIGDHVFMLNLDMVGRNPDKPVQVKGMGSAPGLRKHVEEAIEKTRLKAKLEDGSDVFGGDSDHSSFKNKGIPFTFFFTDFHADYHKPSDHPEKLAYENMVKISKTAGHLLIAISDREERLKFGGGRRVNPDEDDGGGAPRRYLGIQGEPLGDNDCEKLGLGESEGGLRVRSVTEGSVGAQAGLKRGDVILSLDGKTLGREEPREDLLTIMDAVKAGVDVDLVVHRDGKKVTLKAKWEK